MGKFEWAHSPEIDDIGGPVDTRAGVHLSRRRFVSLALYTSAGVVLAGVGPLVTGVDAAAPIAATGPDACMPAPRGSAPPAEVIPFEALERLHVQYRAAEGTI